MLSYLTTLVRCRCYISTKEMDNLKMNCKIFRFLDGNYEVSFKSKVILMHTGEVQWVPPAIYKSSCRIDVKYFPFDTQECEMRFASWTYNAKEVTFMPYIEDRDKKPELTKLLPQHAVSVTSDELYKDDYLESGTWDVISVSIKIKIEQ